MGDLAFLESPDLLLSGTSAQRKILFRASNSVATAQWEPNGGDPLVAIEPSNPTQTGLQSPLCVVLEPKQIRLPVGWLAHLVKLKITFRPMDCGGGCIPNLKWSTTLHFQPPTEATSSWRICLPTRWMRVLSWQMTLQLIYEPPTNLISCKPQTLTYAIHQITVSRV